LDGRCDARDSHIDIMRVRPWRRQTISRGGQGNRIWNFVDRMTGWVSIQREAIPAAFVIDGRINTKPATRQATGASLCDRVCGNDDGSASRDAHQASLPQSRSSGVPPGPLASSRLGVHAEAATNRGRHEFQMRLPVRREWSASDITFCGQSPDPRHDQIRTLRCAGTVSLGCR
jgi:hypothetical protein